MLSGMLFISQTGISSWSISQAARDGLVDLVQTQLKEGEVAINDDDEDGFSALHHASRYNRVGVVRMLIDAGAGKCN